MGPLTHKVLNLHFSKQRGTSNSLATQKYESCFYDIDKASASRMKVEANAFGMKIGQVRLGQKMGSTNNSKTMFIKHAKQKVTLVNGALN